jgi:hypothetical protein
MRLSEELLAVERQWRTKHETSQPFAKRWLFGLH